MSGNNLSNHLKETAIPLIMYRWRDGYYKNDKEAVDALCEIVAEALPLPWSPDGSEPEKTVGWNAFRTEVLKILEGKDGI